jgi:HEAT repeat protein
MFTPSALPRTLEASFRDLTSTRDTTRASAIGDLVRHAREDASVRDRAIPLLELALTGREPQPADPSSAVRSAAALALADLKAHEALASLLVAVEDDDAYVRQMALTALGEIGDPRARPRLERALKDRRPEVRYQAVIAFARAAGADAAVAGCLADALDDADPEIRYIAMRLAEEHEAGGELPRLAATLLDGDPADDPALAVAAALYLARRGDARGHRAVVDVVAGSLRTPVLEDERACVEVAGELGLREAVGHLEKRVWGGSGARRALRRLFGGGDAGRCVWHARVALATMGHDLARSEILRDLSSWRRETREAAAVAAARSGLVPTPSCGGEGG